MTTFANGESGLSVRTKINNVLQHADGTAGELVINEAGADVDFRVESDTNANALFVDGATGNVGVGTSSVSSVFGTTVKVFSSGSGGTLDVGGSTVNARLFGSEGLSIAGFGTSTNHPFILFTNDTERLRVNSSGNVGIGTSSPAAKLVVNSASALASVPAVGSNAGLFVATVGAQDYGLISGALNDGSYFFQSQTTNGTSATYPILLNPNGGNVGIGTSSPATLLHLGGASNKAVRLDTALGNAAFLAGWENTLQIGVNRNPANGVLTDGGKAAAAVRLVGEAGNSYLTVETTSTNNAAPTERLRIDANGNVGIGTSSPAGKLHVSGSAEAVSTRVANTDATGMTTVEFSDGTNAKGQIWAGNGSYALFGGAGSMNYSANSGPHVWYTNYTERLRIDASGNLLIGTTTSGASKLRISGLPTSSAGLSAGDVWNDAGTLKIA